MDTTNNPVPVLTLGQIRGAKPAPCVGGWHALLDGLGQPRVGFDPTIEVTLGDIACINRKARGISLAVDDTLWCLQCLPLEQACFWAHSLVSPAVERAKQHAEAAGAATWAARWAAERAAESAEAAWVARAAEAAAGAAGWAAEAADAAEAAEGNSLEAWHEERRAQLDDISRLCPPLHSTEE